jgi:DNA-binding NarL/FixJ family response regulator
MLRCVLVDDSPDFLAAATTLLESQGASVVGAARTSDEAVQVVIRLRPDVTLLDVHLAEESGFDVARRLLRETGVNGRQLVLISTDAADDYADLVSEAAVAGFLSKSALSVERIRRLTSPDG